MTVREVVETVKKNLGEINIPVSQMQAIGFPIAHAIDGLDAVLKAWDEADKPEPLKFEVVPADEVPEEIRNDTEE